MFDLPSIRIGRLFGIPVEVNATWLVVFVLVAASLSFSYYPSAFPDRPMFVDVTSGIMTALLFFASIVIHEFSHSLVARTGGIRIAKVTLFIFGGIAQMEDEPSTPLREFVMAIAGPLASLVLAAVFALSAVTLFRFGVTNVIWGPFEYLAVINLAVAVFNMLPGFPLDGGRVLRALLWGLTGDQLRATRWASVVGQLIGYVLVALAVMGVLAGRLNLIWLGLVGIFIVVLADSAYRHQLARSALHGESVEDLSSREVMVAPGEISVEKLVHEYFLDGPHTRYPVIYEGEVIGLITLDAVKRVPRTEWPNTLVKDVADTDLSRLLIGARDPGDAVLARFGNEASPGALLVVKDGHLAGIVTRADVTSRLRRADHRT